MRFLEVYENYDLARGTPMLTPALTNLRRIIQGEQSGFVKSVNPQLFQLRLK